MSLESQLRRTPLYDRHIELGATMGPFAGWNMPIQYPTGITKEHLAVRRFAGEFDVSHMGNIYFEGEHTLPALQRVTTNNAAAIQPGQAQYTFITNHQGGAIDDALLYNRGKGSDGRDRYLLVVNAATREGDLAWIRKYSGDFSDLQIDDKTLDLGMISLQGPQSRVLLGQFLGDPASMPENRKNRFVEVTNDGHRLLIAGTGYTGEDGGNEIIADREYIGEVWDRLQKSGATPVALGSRDSLRIEAGYPLGGQQYGRDPSGAEIPIFALGGQARIGVSFAPEKGDYIGREALWAQRQESDALYRGDLSTPLDERVLKRVIQPISLLEGTKPLKHGNEIFLGGRQVGWVTSGAVVPYSHFYGEGVTAIPTDENGMRSIALALLDSDVRYSGHGKFHGEDAIILSVNAEFGTRKKIIPLDARLDVGHLKTLPGYSHPLTEPIRPVLVQKADPVTPDDLERIIGPYVRSHVAKAGEKEHDRILLVPSVITMTPLSRFVSILLAGEYAEHKELVPNEGEHPFYPNTGFLIDDESAVDSRWASYFDVSQVETKPISGQMGITVAAEAWRAYKNRHRKGIEREGVRVVARDLMNGGHLSSQPNGAINPSLAMDIERGVLALEKFPVHQDNRFAIDVEATMDLDERWHPDVYVFGGSMIIEREPIAEFSRAIHDKYGKNNPNRPILVYDAAHVLGILGDHFQSPFKEGIDLVVGSTHKTLRSQQRGLILGNFDTNSEQYFMWELIKTRMFPGNVSSHHPGTLVASYIDALELDAFKDVRQRQILSNARALETALDDEGIRISGNSVTHQVLPYVGHGIANTVSASLVDALINTNAQANPYDSGFSFASSLRMGTNEMTDRGFNEEEFRQVAAFVADVHVRHMKPSVVAEKVREFRIPFQDWRYALSREQARPLAKLAVETIWGGPL